MNRISQVAIVSTLLLVNGYFAGAAVAGPFGKGSGFFGFGRTKAFVFHHTGRHEPGAAAVKRELECRGLSVQYVMDRKGNITRTGRKGGDHVLPGWGAGAGLSSANSIGMEVIAYNDRDVNAAQIAAAVKFMAENYPNLRVIGHGQVNPGHKQASEGRTLTNAVRRDRIARAKRSVAAKNSAAAKKKRQ